MQRFGPHVESFDFALIVALSPRLVLQFAKSQYYRTVYSHCPRDNISAHFRTTSFKLVFSKTEMIQIIIAQFTYVHQHDPQS